MQPVHTAGVLGHQVVAVVADQANYAAQVLSLDLPKTPMMLGDQSNSRGVVDVGLAAVPGREQPGPSRQGGRHVDNVLAVSHKPLRNAQSQAGCPFHRPLSLGPAVRELELITERGRVYRRVWLVTRRVP